MSQKYHPPTIFFKYNVPYYDLRKNIYMLLTDLFMYVV